MPYITDEKRRGPEPVAIVSMACRLPGSIDSASKFWQLLREKRSVQTAKVPPTRFNIDAHYHPDLSRPGSYSSLGGYFLDENPVDFDPTFFNMTPVEAQWLDPQQRKMLEVCYEVFENAGLSLQDVAGSNTGVYVATFTSDYQQMSVFERDFRHNYAATGVDPGIISSRINNIFDLKGPSSVINTACSSGMYAIHNACHALRTRDCDAAVAAGSNLIMMVDQQLNTAKLGVLSPTSECHTFDESADGYGRAEGVGALYLKRLSDAIRDNDVIRGVIRTSAVNTNGKVDGMGITFPNALGQERVLRQAYERAGLDPAQTAYLECHGTGTPTGDPIEVKAVAKGMNDTRSTDRPLLLGAAKASIGHSEAASGIFATMKAALMTENGQIPGVHGFKKLNPNIKDKEWNVEIVKDLMPWPEEFDVRRASVSSFGYGGTNAHLVVEAIESLCPWYEHGTPKNQATYTYDQGGIDRPFLVTMSAHDRKTLAKNIQAHQAVAADYYLPDLAYTLNQRKTQFNGARGYTIVWPGRETESFSQDSFALGSKIAMSQDAKLGVGFVFTGQGAQWAHMGMEAMRLFPTFNETVSALDRILQRVVEPKYRPSWSLRKVLEAPAESSRVGQPDISQPACTAIQIAVVDLFASWGISPTVSIGHSSGEMAAAYAAGRISAPEAILASYFRGLAVARLAPEGTMLAIGLGADKVQHYIDALPPDEAGGVSIACENSPGSTTVSGFHDEVEKLKDIMHHHSIFARQIKTGKAYHSHHMEAVAPLYEQLYVRAQAALTFGDLSWRQCETGMVSSVTGLKVEEMRLDIAYWCENLRNRVRFDTAVQALGHDDQFKTVKILTEIGPHSTLKGPLKQIIAEHNFDLQYVGSLIRGQDDAVSLLRTAGELHVRGFDINFDRINAINPAPLPIESKHTGGNKRQARYLVDLPPYQWNYERQHWYEPRAIADLRTCKHPRHDLLGRRIFGLSRNAPAWRNILRCRDVSWFSHHTLGTDVIFPAAGHISLAIEALLQQLDLEPAEAIGVRLASVDIQKALIVPDTDDGVEVHTRLEQSDSDAWYTFTVESVAPRSGNWTLHSAGKIKLSQGQENQHAVVPYGPIALHQRVASKRWYRSLERAGFRYGPEFQTMTSQVRANGKDRWASAGIKVQTKQTDLESRYMLHPSTMDGCLHAIIAAVHRGQHKEMPWGVIPLTIEDMSVKFPGGDSDCKSEGLSYAWARDDPSSSRHFFGNVQLFARGTSDCLLEIRNLKMVAFESAVPPTSVERGPRAPYTRVEWKQSDEASEYLKTNKNTTSVESRVVVLLHDEQPAQSTISKELGCIARTISEATVDNLEDFDDVIIDDADGSILALANEKSWMSLRTLLLGSKKPIVWVTRGANAGKSASSGLPQGFLRAVRSESPGIRICLVDADDETPISTILALLRHQTAVLKSANMDADAPYDVEFWLTKDSRVLIPRLESNDSLNRLVYEQELEHRIEALSAIASYKGNVHNDQLVWETVSETAKLRPHAVEIQVQLSTLTKGDISTNAEGAGARFVVGIIVRTGSDLDHNVLNGRAVVAYYNYRSGDALTTHIVTSDFALIDKDMNETQMADLTASLPQLVETVDALGLENIKNVKYKNVVILATTDDTRRKLFDIVGAQLGFHVSTILGVEDHNKMQETLSSANLVVTTGTPDAEIVQQIWKAMPTNSDFVFGFDTRVDLYSPLDMKPFGRGVRLRKVGKPSKATLELGIEMMKTLGGTLQAPTTITDVTELSDSLQSVRKNMSMIEKDSASTILRIQYGESKVKVKPLAWQTRLSPNAAYVLVGCLGGLGRSITTWMLERGCRNFVFLSRSGAAKPEAVNMIGRLTTSGASVQVLQVDASDNKAVADAVQCVSRRLPIRGAVHAAMVLQDGLFENMTFSAYQAALLPKMQGAIALNEALAHTELDFFLLTSSISAVLGNPGQANYCAANSFLDYLALERRRRGLPACSIALPMVDDVGVVAESQATADALARKMPFGINEKDMLTGFEAAIIQGRPTGNAREVDLGDVQLVLGLEPPAMLQAMADDDVDISDAFWHRDARLSSVRTSLEAMQKEQGAVVTGQGSERSFIAGLKGLPLDEVIKALAMHIAGRTARILGLEPDTFQLEGVSVAKHGVDSMIGVELQRWLFKEFGLQVGIATLSDPVTTFSSLAQAVVRQSGLDSSV
ncbi:hypothetical protein F4808DRAFT_447810 [Astrocystis sublimbata]|nr:hypothetical protein F4808DRAFT_447810 [Astrocystis sublimbata]